MARQDKKKLKVLPAARVAKKAKNMLIEGAAAMSGKSVKSIAASLIGGAIGEAAMDKRKIRRKAQRDQFTKSLQKTKKQFKVEVDKPSTGVGIKDTKSNITVGRPIHIKQPLNKKSTNKMKKESPYKMKGPGQKSPAKAIGGGKYIEGFKKMTTKKLFDVVKRNDRGLESGRKEIVKRTQEKGDANSIYQAMTANDSTNTAKRVIRNRIKKGTFDDGSLKTGENPFKMKGFSGFGNSPLNDTVKNYKATKEADYKKHRGVMKEKYAAEDRKDPLTANIMKTRSEKMRGSKRFQDYRAIGPR